MRSHNRELTLDRSDDVRVRVSAFGDPQPHIAAIEIDAFWHTDRLAMTIGDLERLRDRITVVLLEARDDSAYRRWRIKTTTGPERIKALLEAEPDEVDCEHCRGMADEVRSVGMDHRNYGPGICDECGTEWPYP